MRWDTFKQDNYSTVGGDGGCRVGEVPVNCCNKPHNLQPLMSEFTVMIKMVIDVAGVRRPSAPPSQSASDWENQPIRRKGMNTLFIMKELYILCDGFLAIPSAEITLPVICIMTMYSR